MCHHCLRRLILCMSVPGSARHIPRLARLACCAFALAACRKDSTTGPSATPAAMRLEGGNGQTATVGTALASSARRRRHRRRRQDGFGRPGRLGCRRWAGTASPASSTSNSDGVATTTWTLGTVAGTLRVSAQVGGLAPVVFTATALAGTATIVVTTPDRAYLGSGRHHSHSRRPPAISSAMNVARRPSTSPPPTPPSQRSCRPDW